MNIRSMKIEMKKIEFFICILMCIIFLGINALANEPIPIALKGKVTLVDVTFDGCETCERMLPVVEKIKKDYGGKIAVVMVDFWNNPQIVKQIGTNTAPTILIFDKSGKEVFRNYGYISEEELVFHLNTNGVQLEL